MAVAQTDIETLAVADKPQGYWRGVGRRFLKDKVAVGAGCVAGGLILMAIFAPWIAPQDPFQGTMIRRLSPIGTEGYPLGADELGRDMLSRLIYGGRLSLFMGVTPVLIAFVIGSVIGITAGFAGGWVNSVIMRVLDVFYAFPSVLLAIAISGALGAGIMNGLLSLTVVFIPPIARVAESVTTAVRKLEYIEAARASGAAAFTIVRVHVLGNVLGPIFVYATSLISVSMILAAGLSLSGARRQPAQCGMGADAQHAQECDLRPALARRTSGGDDLSHLHLLQHAQRRAALGHGYQAMSDAILSAHNLVKHFSAGGWGAARKVVRAVDDVSFEVAPGETLGVVGESGCGKSTAARLLTQLLPCDSGEVRYRGRSVGTDVALKDFRRHVQMVFQDSYASLNPRMTMLDAVAFGPTVHGIDRPEARRRANALLDRVGLDPARFGPRYPHEISGGQRQRVNIARALAFDPDVIVLDEAVSALDKSVEAQVLNLLTELRRERGLTYIFISHDLNVVRHISDRVMVMYLGEVVEIGPTSEIYATPRHPYSGALLAAMPSLDPDRRTLEAPLQGDPPNPIDPPSGCRFHTRCAQAFGRCSRRNQAPPPSAAAISRPAI